jgi:putative inorganic carbon (HCO3(-)) transporter
VINWRYVAGSVVWISALAATLACLSRADWWHAMQHCERQPVPARLSGLAHAAAWVLRAEPWLVLVSCPCLIFPNRWTPLALPLLALPWLVRGLRGDVAGRRTPMDGAILLLLLMLPASLAVSMDLQRSLVKLYGIFLGVAVFYAVVNHVRRPAQAWWVGVSLALTGLPMSVLALLGTAWPAGKLVWMNIVYRHLPGFVFHLTGLVRGKFNANEVGAVLCLLVPLTASLLWLGFPTGNASANLEVAPSSTEDVLPGASQRIVRALLTLTLLVMLITLFLTLSRSALLGVGVALFCLLLFRPRWLIAVLLLASLALIGAWYRLGSGYLLGLLAATGAERNVTIRFEIWQRALEMVRDHPWTGVGLNTFSLVANARYRLFSASPEEVLQLTHAHNAFLQVAVDLGIPGLVAYVALLLDLVLAGWIVWRRWPTESLASRPAGRLAARKMGPLQALSAGVLCSVLAYHVFGLTDCITLGAKPGVLLWAALGLEAALANLAVAAQMDSA